MRWCARCGEPIDGGLLLCATCVPRDRLRQDVQIRLIEPATAMVDADDRAVELRPGRGTSRVRAREMPSSGGISRSRLRAVEKVEWIHDRQRDERRVWLFDHRDRVYSETCFDLVTGAITWGPKLGSLHDQSLHSRRSTGGPPSAAD